MTASRRRAVTRPGSSGACADCYGSVRRSSRSKHLPRTGHGSARQYVPSFAFLALFDKRIQRAPRQSNGHDCGPFATADLVSLFTSDMPSAKTQGDMRSWREHMLATVAPLECSEYVPKERRVPIPDEQVFAVSESD